MTDLLPPEPGTVDQWWPASDETTPLVDMLVLGAAHHHATGHLCGGGGFSFDCDVCDFAIEEGVVLAGGWVRFKADDDARESSQPAGPDEGATEDSARSPQRGDS